MTCKAFIILHKNFNETDIKIFATNDPTTTPLLPESADYLILISAAFAALFEDNWAGNVDEMEVSYIIG